ncbi:hypothetical protein [Streptomyces sp. NPDC002676]
MDAIALTNTRFAISPLNTTVSGLWLLRSNSPAFGGGWRPRIQETIRQRKLEVLRVLFSGSWDYVPDFITPQPDTPEATLEDELHAVAMTDSDRLRLEVRIMTGGVAEHRVVGRAAPAIMRKILEDGERALAKRLATELDQLWHAAIAPHWTTLRTLIEADIDHRARITARHGLSGMLASLHPRVAWNDDHLRLTTRFPGRFCGTTSLVLTPSVFATDLLMVVDSGPHPVQRQPMFTYPVRSGPDAGARPTSTTPDLLGVTRARLLSDLGTARTTAELGERHFLAASTVSYHLGILHRAGLIARTRRGHHVLYERTPRAASLLGPERRS